MLKKFIAISPENKGFIFKRCSMIATPAASAEKICNFLNSINYQINAGEKWYIHDNDYYFNSLITKEIRRFKPGHNIKIYKAEA